MPCFCLRLRSAANSKSFSISSRLSLSKFNKSRLLIKNCLLAREDLLQNTQSLGDFFLGNRQRRSEPQNFVSRAIEQKPFFHAFIGDLCTFDFELESEEQTLAANPADKGESILQLCESLGEKFSRPGAVLQNAALEKRPHDRQADTAHQGVSAEGRCVTSRNETLRYLFASQHRSDGQPAT